MGNLGTRAGMHKAFTQGNEPENKRQNVVISGGVTTITMGRVLSQKCVLNSIKRSYPALSGTLAKIRPRVPREIIFEWKECNVYVLPL